MRENRGGTKGKWILLGVAVILAMGLGVYLFSSSRSGKGLPPIGEEPETGAMVSKPESPPEVAKAPLPGIRVTLAESDEWVRKKVLDLSTQTRWQEWLMNKNLVRRITAAVVNIAEGKSPRRHLGFLGSHTPFSALKKDEKLYMDPQSYGRYDLFADVIASLDATKTMGLYKEFNPLFEEAYRELGYPQGDFQVVLIQAMKELLKVPVVEGDVSLKEAVVSYWMVDDTLEDLSDAQKHLLRMGPQNTRKIQKKLQEMALLLGVPEGQLPRIKTYVPKND
jgi:hypothetical protein